MGTITVLNSLLYPFIRLCWRVVSPTRTGVKVIIKCGDEVLLIRPSYGGRAWTLPGGGLKASETPGDCAKRETAEELGLALPSLHYCGSFVHHGTTHDLIHVYVSQVPEKTAGVTSYEVDELRWFHIDELRSKLRYQWQAPILGLCLRQARLL